MIPTLAISPAVIAGWFYGKKEQMEGTEQKAAYSTLIGLVRLATSSWRCTTYLLFFVFLIGHKPELSPPLYHR